ncbi:MAG: [FeFe] hydrogenase H-cluster maturation GTPase HydF [Pseudoramibacter sp.]
MAVLNETPAGERLHITFFGKRNAGKSSVVNAVTGQDLAVVSEKAGTTTDPVEKTMEILPLGPVLIVDTPGTDDVGELGEKRVERSYREMERTDIAILVVDGEKGLSAEDRDLIERFEAKQLPYLVVYNKADLIETRRSLKDNEIEVSAKSGWHIRELKDKIAAIKPQSQEKPIIRDLVDPGDIVVLVIPIDASAPKGRLILPQQQVLRELLDIGAMGICCRETELPQTLEALSHPPALVVTDSQAFKKVAAVVPTTVRLTSFSILMARHKGFLKTAVEGVKKLDTLKDGDIILMAEGCTHHRQCQDIGTVKLPHWIEKKTGRRLVFETSSGKGFPKDLSRYAMVVHCGGCMQNGREIRSRMEEAVRQGVPFSNYGTVIAEINGILPRSLEVLDGHLE